MIFTRRATLHLPSPAVTPGDGLAVPTGGSPPALLATSRFTPETVKYRRETLASRTNPREDLLAWLHESFGAAASIHPTEAQRQALREAASHDTLFIVTGQQPGLLGGPMLAYYKALSAVALAQRCREQLGVPVLPVFWIAGDDSDLAEANLAEFLWEPPHPPLKLPFDEARRRLPVGHRRLDAAAWQALRTGLPVAWPEDLRRDAEAAYAPGGTLVTGFRHLLHKALGHTGLLFVDAGSPHLRRLTRPALTAVLARAPEFFAALREGEKRMRETHGLEPQVSLPPRALPLFVDQEGERMRLFSTGDEGLGAPPCPEGDLYHDALTRMVATESVLPVLGHVLGPAEMRYAAQLAEVLPRFTGGMPLVHPRQSVLLVPEPLAAAFDAHGLPVEQWPTLTPSQWRRHLRLAAWRRSDASMNPPTAWGAAWCEQAAAWYARHIPRGEVPGRALNRLARALAELEESAREGLVQETSPYRDASPMLRKLALGQGQDRRLNLLSAVAALGWDGLRELEAVLRPAEPGVQVITFQGDAHAPATEES